MYDQEKKKSRGKLQIIPDIFSYQVLSYGFPLPAHPKPQMLIVQLLSLLSKSSHNPLTKFTRGIQGEM